MRSPLLLVPASPPTDDPAVEAILEGLCRATGARGCRLRLQLLPDGPEVVYNLGQTRDKVTLTLTFGPTARFAAVCELAGAGLGPASSPAALDAIQKVFEGALLSVIERCSTGHQLEVLAEILNASDQATLVVDGAGELVYANPRGDELLALQTEKPIAHLAGNGQPGPLLHLIAAEIEALRKADRRSRRQSVTLGDGVPWDLEIVRLSGPTNASYALVILAPTRLPGAVEMFRRFGNAGVSRRETEVLALVLHGKKSCEIAEDLGITEYTVKDHLKHAYSKLGIRSRGQLLARISTDS